ncbi:predicted protein [Sclerotinia sclerotiorum 1980 UF-70]|uniref:Uncharacterized protein n=1 Tax=Sclerotinia sclerotiorum (strain ATCC 18683 / 1980 / Ss-1) TaxID=665079 RepID=A7END0_SCLS1|nr:predicted protein [Sclerotinia sclerotiorum 1980 UF-70]EDO04346.1 predicted protein [Sclerotinia sclerotiorum 1980 UF-70]
MVIMHDGIGGSKQMLSLPRMKRLGVLSNGDKRARQVTRDCRLDLTYTHKT